MSISEDAEDYKLEVEEIDQFVMDRSPNFTPEELLQKMGEAAWRFERACKLIQDMQIRRTKIKEKKRVIILASRIDLIQSERLRAHLVRVFDDPRWKMTKDDIEALLTVELDDAFDNMESKYQKYLVIARTAEKEHEMWQRQLSFYQSKMKKETAELQSLGAQD